MSRQQAYNNSQEKKMTKHTFRSIKTGDVLEVGYRGHLDRCEFLGFTDNTTKYSETPVFKTAAEMLKFAGVTSFSALEEYQEAQNLEYGHHFYAVFKDLSTGDVFSAYLFKGRWVLGTSADVAKLR
jgi:hypothetical protein